MSLESFRGKPVILYFYPKDDTRGSKCSSGGAPTTVMAKTRLQFSGTYPAVLISAILVAVISFPLFAFAFLVSTPWRYLGIALALATGLAVVIRARRISLVLTPDGLEIHNFWQSYWLPWATIESIAPTDRSMLGVGPGEQTLEFVLRGGSRVHSQATFGPPMRYAAELKAMRRYADEWGIQMPDSQRTLVA